MTVDRDINSHADRRDLALAIWEASQPARGTLVQSYLESRDIVLPPPPTLRFHPGLKRPAGSVWPAMVALVTAARTKRRLQFTELLLPPAARERPTSSPTR
jgi:hypothetical protein